MNYELICACGDHIKLVKEKEVPNQYIGYCLGCNQGFVIILKGLSKKREVYYHESSK